MAKKNETPPATRGKIRLVTFGLLFLFAMGFTAYDVLIAYPQTAHTGDGAKIQFVVPKGIGPSQLTDALAQRNVISSPGKFGLWLKLSKQFPKVKAGEFELTTQMSPKEIIETLQGRSLHKGIRITVPEGFMLNQIGAALETASLVSVSDFRNACFDVALLRKLGIPAKSAEGFLFPDTYYFDKGVTAAEVVEKMFGNFQQKLASLQFPGNPPTGQKLLALITLASIVQAEAKVSSEAPVIAGIYTNRLDSKKFPSRRLQADPTVAYGCNPFLPSKPASCSTFKGTLGAKQLTDANNPYNTYKNAGLPPGPICAPGINAIQAAMTPQKVPYLYFVVSSNGKHQFSTTLAEHQEAVKAYRQSSGQ